MSSAVHGHLLLCESKYERTCIESKGASLVEFLRYLTCSSPSRLGWPVNNSYVSACLFLPNSGNKNACPAFTWTGGFKLSFFCLLTGQTLYLMNDQARPHCPLLKSTAMKLPALNPFSNFSVPTLAMDSIHLRKENILTSVVKAHQHFMV